MDQPQKPSPQKPRYSLNVPGLKQPDFESSEAADLSAWLKSLPPGGTLRVILPPLEPDPAQKP